MKKAFKIFLIVLSTIIIISGSCVVVFAHPGKTDSDGGHFDRSTGEYHYHHGYPAHQHENGSCPYDFDKNEKSNYYNDYDSEDSSIDFDSIRDKAKIKDLVNEYLNDYERLNNFYESAQNQISNTGAMNQSLYTDFCNLNESVANSLQDYKEYLDNDTYNKIEKQTVIYSEFLENNIPDEKTQSYLDSDVIIKSFCYFVLGLYFIEIIVCVIILIICKKKNIQTFLSNIDLFITGIIYLIISAIYFAPLFADYEKQWQFLLFLYIPAPIISAYFLSLLCNDVKKKKTINDVENLTPESAKDIAPKDNKTHFVKYTNDDIELPSETKSKIKDKATKLYNISNSIKCEHSRLSNILSQYLLITNSNLTPIEYFNIKNQIENLKNIFPKEYYSFVLQYEYLKDLVNIPDNCIIFNDICYQKSGSQFKKQNNIPKEYQKLKEIIKNNNIKLKINDNNNILDKNSSFYTNLDKVTRYSIFSNRTRQSILNTIDINTDFFSIEPYADFPIHLEPYINRDGKKVFLAILTRTDEDLGEINAQKSELIYNNSDHKITAKIVEITGGEPPKKYYGCNIKVTIE